MNAEIGSDERAGRLALPHLFRRGEHTAGNHADDGRGEGARQANPQPGSQETLMGCKHHVEPEPQEPVQREAEASPFAFSAALAGQFLQHDSRSQFSRNMLIIKTEPRKRRSKLSRHSANAGLSEMWPSIALIRGLIALRFVETSPSHVPLSRSLCDYSHASLRRLQDYVDFRAT